MTDQDEGLAELESRIAYCFNDKQLLVRSLTHPSYLTVDPTSRHNQRLEFLGDAVIGLILAEALFEQFPEEREGTLTRSRSMLANGDQLSGLAREIDLGSVLRLGEAEEAQGGRERDSILEDAFESLIGAVYLDSGLESVSTVVRQIYGPLVERLENQTDSHNPKGRLQELLQPDLGNDAIEYKVTAESGPDHEKEFTIEVWVDGVCKGSGSGASKKLAEEQAARMALEIFEPTPDS